MKAIRLTICAAIGCAWILAANVQANTVLDLTGALGYVVPGTSADTADNAGYINGLVARANGVDPAPYDIAGNTYVLLNNPTALLPFADPSHDKTGGVGGDNSVDASGYQWLIIKYDGANGEAYVWNVTGLGVVDVPAFDPADNSNNKYLLFNTSDPLPPSNVPDSGSTLFLTSLVLGAFGFLRRKLS